jgi:hypothetical protein
MKASRMALDSKGSKLVIAGHQIKLYDSASLSLLHVSSSTIYLFVNVTNDYVKYRHGRDTRRQLATSTLRQTMPNSFLLLIKSDPSAFGTAWT